MNDILLSIVIATKNRGAYCIESIRTILDSVDQRAELVVHDNSDQVELRDLVAQIDDNRLIYRYNNSPLSVVHNYNEALALSSGTYVCLLGDDDTVTPDIIAIAEWMNSHHIESVGPAQNISYIWPNSNVKGYESGLLDIPVFKAVHSRIDVDKQLVRLLRDGIIDYQQYGLPRIYHGLVKRSCLEAVREQTSHYIGGLSTDIYATFSLSCVVKSHFTIDYPFTIAGACPASTTVAGLTGDHIGDLQSAPHFVNRGPYEWEACIPRFYSIETIWAESALKALRDMKRMDLYRRFNLYHFLTTVLIRNRKGVLALAVESMTDQRKRLGINRFYFWGRLNIGIFSWLVSRVNKKRKHSNTQGYHFDNVSSLAQAVEVTNVNLKDVQSVTDAQAISNQR